MTQKISVLSISLLAAAALTAERFVSAAGTVATAAGNAIGVTCTSAEIGDLVATDVLGTAVVTAGGAIAKGAAIQVGADGKAVTQAAGVTVAWALQAATADGDRIEVLLVSNGPAASAG